MDLPGAEEIIDEAAHPYTRALIAAVCELISGKSNTIKEIPIKEEMPSAADIPPGCRFHLRFRCLYAKPRCQEEEPILKELESGHQVACHYPFD